MKYTYSKTETTPAVDGDEEVVEVENDEVRSALQWRLLLGLTFVWEEVNPKSNPTL